MKNAETRPLLRMHCIRKAFDGVEVLHGVDFALEAGQVHALVGENGAGKSTLINILGGVHQDFAGTIHINGQAARPRDTRQAERCGVAIIHQELALIPHMTVAENIYLGREPRNALGWVNQTEMRSRARALLSEKLDADIDVSQRVAELPIAAQQTVEIAKALSRDARILVMDEPTSALPDAAVKKLFDMIRQLRAQDAGIIYISHKLDEIFQIADQITVLRDGHNVGSAAASDLDPNELVRRMVGRTIDQFFPRHAGRPGAELLCLSGLSVADAAAGRDCVRDVDLCLRAGEIVGLTGLLGSGVSDVLGAAFGRYGRRTRGRVHVRGTRVNIRAPRDAIANGIALLTNDRAASGLVMPMSMLANMTLASLGACQRAGMLSPAIERRRGDALATRMKLAAATPNAAVSTLSGGNQQKVVLAKWLMSEPHVLLLDEPTRGIDVGAKADIYALMNELVEAGAGILLVSSELPELLALSDRVIVMHRGRIVAEFERADATQEQVMLAAMGGGVNLPAGQADLAGGLSCDDEIGQVVDEDGVDRNFRV